MTLRLITLVGEREQMTHIPSSHGNYATICGLSSDDAEFKVVPTQINAEIDCVSCYEIWAQCKRIRASRFALILRRSAQETPR